MNTRELVNVPNIGNPQWYSDAAVYSGLVWTAGQIPAGPDGVMPDAFEAQVEIVFDNLERTLEVAGASLDTLIKINAYLLTLDDFEAYNAEYVRRIGPHGLPPRTTVQIASFPPLMKIELEAVAFRQLT